MRRPAAAYLVLVLALACADAQRDAQPDVRPAVPPAVRAAPESITPSVASGPPAAIDPVSSFCSDTSETVALRCSAAVIRRGDTLVISLARAGVVRRTSNLVETEQHLRFQYHGRMAGGNGASAFHVIDVEGYESGAVELIDAATGDSLTLASYPILSLDASRFVVAAASMETCEGTSRLEVWGITGATPVREYSIDPFRCWTNEGWGPTSVEWRSSDTISFVRSSLHTDPARRRRDEYDSARGTLVRRAGVWTLDSTSVGQVPRKIPDDPD